MSLLEQALALAAQGFHVFPVTENGKTPVIKDFPNRATRDPEQLRKWFTGTEYNIGISTTRFSDGEALVVVDVDCKGKDGEASLVMLELDGRELPASLEQSTPSGGRHIIYRAPHACRQGVDVLGPGLDVRSRGGYIVGPGSTIDGKSYRQINGHSVLASAPQWLVSTLGAAKERPAVDRSVLSGVDPDRAASRAIEWVLANAPTDNDPEAYPIACRVKDFGVSEEVAVQILQEHWDPRCNPPRTDDTATTVRNAYRYGREPAGVSAPEAVFEKSTPPEDEDAPEHPVRALNKEYAFIKNGAYVLQETTDVKGRFATLRMTPGDMHAWFSNKLIALGDKQVPLSRAWMQDPARREFDSVVFSPLSQVEGRFYNLWRGFTVQPAATAEHPAVAAFLDHALQNVCGGDEALFRWLMGWFAHMIQRPYEKPLVALAFKGEKGTGKNALVERVGRLLGDHFMVADDERYLLGNFNAHMENALFFVLDEASWAGDKRAEGKLKSLITGQQHVIERKGQEAYKVDNLTRVAIIGNEEWLVPASVDERRFAVFAVGNGRKQDRRFFEDMRIGLEQGGYSHLLRYLMDFDLSTVDVNCAPTTQALIDQKHASLESQQEWWLDCISSDSLVGSDWEGTLPPMIPTNRMREAFERWARGRNIRSRLPGRNDFMKNLTRMAPALQKIKARPDAPEDSTYSFKNPGIEVLRADWCRFIGGEHDWNK